MRNLPEMKVVVGLPPNIEKIRKAFKFDEKDTVFTYGDTIYNPGDFFLSPDLITHETVHSLQQGNRIEGWWVKYIREKDFRLDQEVRAYHQQYVHICELIKDRNKQEQMLFRLAEFLSSPMYGSIVNIAKARNLIKNGF
jgi:hypothetical protein